MLNGIDISRYQGDINLSPLPIDFVICKATEGIKLIDAQFKNNMSKAINLGLLTGFYHFANKLSPKEECIHFLNTTINYRGIGIPCLDWEGVYDLKTGKLIYDQPVSWINEFVKYYHKETGCWCWIYANPWRFNQGGVEPNCGRWIAQYPLKGNPNFSSKLPAIPKTDGLVCAWQFSGTGRINGYNGNLDLNRFYGDKSAWNAYAKAGTSSDSNNNSNDNNNKVVTSVLENDEYKIIVERK